MPDTKQTLFAALIAAIMIGGWLTMASETRTSKTVLRQASLQSTACSHDRALDAGLSGYLPKSPPVSVPNSPFMDADGGPVTISDFRGQGVLLNFWATWCAPCVEEMPALDRADAALAPDGIRVVAVSEDRNAPETTPPFYANHGLTSLGMYADDAMAFAREVNIGGLPTTLLIDRQGREVAAVLGAAEWDAPSVIEFIRQCLGSDG